MTKLETKTLILDAAERLFAEKGFAATSLRTITSQARVNLAACNYHFGSKEGLFKAVMARRLKPLTEERLRMLDAAEAAVGPPELEAVLEAFIAPTLRMIENDEPGGSSFIRLVACMRIRPHEAIERVFVNELRETAERFGNALRRALPDLPFEEVYWRMLYAVSATGLTAMQSVSNGMAVGPAAVLKTAVDIPKEIDVEKSIERLVVFLAAGMRSKIDDNEKGGGE